MFLRHLRVKLIGILNELPEIRGIHLGHPKFIEFFIINFGQLEFKGKAEPDIDRGYLLNLEVRRIINHCDIHIINAPKVRVV
jgi:hypothetical protein